MQKYISLNYKDELLLNLKNKEYRDAFVASHINNSIPFQIKTIREGQHLTQEELGNIAGKMQPLINRLENPNYGNYTLKTLKEIASAFDVGLTVRFVPISDLVKWELTLSEDSLNVLSYDKDSYFIENSEPSTTADSAKYPAEGASATTNNVVYLKDHVQRQESRMPVTGSAGNGFNFDMGSTANG